MNETPRARLEQGTPVSGNTLPATAGAAAATLADGFNRVLACVILILVSPVMLATALAVKADAPSAPVIYRQERVGVNRRQGSRSGVRLERRRSRGEGKPFEIWKFRTMVPDAESRTGPIWASADDPRITRVGRFLRRTRIDELPQLLNVIRGEMRLVGPRPERPHFVEKLVDHVPDYRRRLSVPPGITGLAQVEREYDADIDDVRKKLRYDLFYIENRRPMMDLKILAKTVSVVLLRKGAR
jgi:lipopolysaccharide/colanic/teichoic acid biosynthesis glycosyltransferase